MSDSERLAGWCRIIAEKLGPTTDRTALIEAAEHIEALGRERDAAIHILSDAQLFAELRRRDVYTAEQEGRERGRVEGAEDAGLYAKIEALERTQITPELRERIEVVYRRYRDAQSVISVDVKHLLRDILAATAGGKQMSKIEEPADLRQQREFLNTFVGTPALGNYVDALLHCIEALERERDEARELAELFKPDDEPDLPWNVSAWPAATEESK